MGLFSSLGKSITGIVKQAGSDIAGGLDLLSAGFSHPIKTVSAVSSFIVNPSTTTAQNINKVVQQTIKEGPVKTITNTVINTAATAAVLTSGVSLLGGTGTAAKIGSVVNAAVVKHPLLTLTTPVTVPLVTNLLTTNPDIVKKITEIPEDSGNLGRDIGDLSKDLTLEKGYQFLKDHPYASTAAAVSALAGLGYTTAAAIAIYSNYQNTKAVEKNTAATIDQSSADIPNSKINIPNNLGGSNPAASTINIYTAPVPNTQSPAENIGGAATAVVPVSKPAVATTKKSIKKKKAVKKKKKKVYKKKKTIYKRRSSKKVKKKRK
jgi:hypothetical protein